MSERTNEVVGVVSHMKKSGVLKPVIIGFALGIVLLLIGGFAFSDEEKQSETADHSTTSYEEFLQYKESVRREVEGLARSVSGVEQVSAVVFFDGVGGSIYARNTQSGNVLKEEYVIIGSGSSSHALYIGESLPPLSGIGVVCDTGDRAALRNELAALLAATYGLPLTRVYVSEGG